MIQETTDGDTRPGRYPCILQSDYLPQSRSESRLHLTLCFIRAGVIASRKYDTEPLIKSAALLNTATISNVPDFEELPNGAPPSRSYQERILNITPKQHKYVPWYIKFKNTNGQSWASNA